MATVPADWKKSAIAITPGFEVQGDPYMGASGDFDGMGVSCGALQWNIGQNSLQPLVQAVGKAHVIASMPTIGPDFWAACNTSIAKGLKIVRGWQNGTSLKAKPKAELRSFMGTPEMRTQQDKRIDEVMEGALRLATNWAKSEGGGDPTKRLFCWFFDIATQNGSMEGLKRKRVLDFIGVNKPDKTDDLICDFLSQQKGTSGHVKDAKKNAGAWRNKASDEQLELLTMTYLRSETANPKWRHVVINRKGTISMGLGRVNSTDHNFSVHGL